MPIPQNFMRGNVDHWGERKLPPCIPVHPTTSMMINYIFAAFLAKNFKLQHLYERNPVS
jgi:hypothetical protein